MILRPSFSSSFSQYFKRQITTSLTATKLKAPKQQQCNLPFLLQRALSSTTNTANGSIPLYLSSTSKPSSVSAAEIYSVRL